VKTEWVGRFCFGEKQPVKVPAGSQLALIFLERGVKFFKKEVRMFLKPDGNRLRLSFGK